MDDRADANGRRSGAWIGLALVAGVLAIYGQTLGFDFVVFDDDQYVTENPIVQRGLSPRGHRLRLLEGRDPDGHPPRTRSPGSPTCSTSSSSAWRRGPPRHQRRAARARRRAAVRRAAQPHGRHLAQRGGGRALWAWHPLRVESVAWVAERKDVLSGVFAMLTLCVTRATRAASRARPGCGTFVCFALGLLAKPTLVPLPFALLLLDFWPLARQRVLRAAACSRSSPSSRSPRSRACSRSSSSAAS